MVAGIVRSFISHNSVVEGVSQYRFDSVMVQSVATPITEAHFVKFLA